MKKTLLLLFLCVGQTLYAQISIGPKLGLNSFKVDPEASSVNYFFKSKYGGTVGFFVKYKISTRFSVQSELLYSQQGYKEEFSYVPDPQSVAGKCTIKFTTHNLNIPVLMKFYPWEGFNLEVGPQVGFNFANNRDISFSLSDNPGDSDWGKATFKTVDLALIFGVGYEFNNRITTSLRYNLGLTSMTDELFGKAYNRGFQLSVGYLFDLK